MAYWAGPHHAITATLPADSRGWLDITMPTPAQRCDPQAAADFADALDDARAAAEGANLGWLQYRAFDVDMLNGHVASRGAAATIGPEATTFSLADILELHVARAAEGRAILFQQRTFDTLTRLTPWASLPLIHPGTPLQLRHTQCPSCRSHHRSPTRSPQGKSPPA